MRSFTMEDNNICIGYAMLAVEIYNRRVELAQEHKNYQDEYYHLEKIPEKQQRAFKNCLYAAFDRYSEVEAEQASKEHS